MSRYRPLRPDGPLQPLDDRLYALCAEIPGAERKKDRGAFFRSIHGTLNHLLFGDVVWMGRFQGTGTPVAIIAEFRFMESDGRAIRGADGQVSKVVVVSCAKEGGRNRVFIEA